MNCFFCDNTGKICNICGESAEACECEPEGVDEYEQEYGPHSQFQKCPECGGKSASSQDEP